ncbi:excalibur calcium-binding domain-containing protein [Mycobacterium bohemicum]|nr:excalibur calcium-binding domain-containing protein [Mycobacterium bohemicum]
MGVAGSALGHADPSTTPTTSAPSAYYPNCRAACAAGVAPLHRGDPGYRPGLDRDNDGIACEWCP